MNLIALAVPFFLLAIILELLVVPIGTALLQNAVWPAPIAYGGLSFLWLQYINRLLKQLDKVVT